MNESCCRLREERSKTTERSGPPGEVACLLPCQCCLIISWGEGSLSGWCRARSLLSAVRRRAQTDSDLSEVCYNEPSPLFAHEQSHFAEWDFSAVQLPGTIRAAIELRKRVYIAVLVILKKKAPRLCFEHGFQLEAEEWTQRCAVLMYASQRIKHYLGSVFWM